MPGGLARRGRHRQRRHVRHESRRPARARGHRDRHRGRARTAGTSTPASAASTPTPLAAAVRESRGAAGHRPRRRWRPLHPVRRDGRRPRRRRDPDDAGGARPAQRHAAGEPAGGHRAEQPGRRCRGAGGRRAGDAAPPWATAMSASACVAEGGRLGGESSGHIICAEVSPTGDGLVAALKVIEVMLTTGWPLSELRRVLRKFPQASTRCRCRTKPPLESLPALQAADARRREPISARPGTHDRSAIPAPSRRSGCWSRAPTPPQVRPCLDRLVAAVRADVAGA